MKAKLTISSLLIALMASSYGSTIFITNNSTSKTLASNESDAFDGTTTLAGGGTETNGLDLDADGDSTVLSLSSDDSGFGGGNITFETVAVTDNLSMDSNSMGNSNDKWGNSQIWEFTLDQDITFDALTFNAMDEDGFVLQSSAWGSDTINDTGQEWTFSASGGVGTFTLLGSSNGAGTYDFSDAGASVVSAGTSITIGYPGGANGGEQLSSFQITPVPEPSAFGLLAGCFGLTWIMLNRRSSRS